MKILTLGILCIAFLVINFLLRKMLSYVRAKSRIMGIVHRYFPLFEMTFWGLFIFWISSVLFSDSSFYTYLIIILIILVLILFFLYFLKDYVAGIQLKSRYNFSTGQSFKSGQISGIVKKSRLLYLEIKGDNESDFKIPYAKIEQSSIELNIQEKSGGESIIKVWIDQRLDKVHTAKKIVEMVLNSPWSSTKSTPQVLVQETEKGQTCYEISCITQGDHANRKLKELIEKNFSRPKK